MVLRGKTIPHGRNLLTVSCRASYTHRSRNRTIAEPKHWRAVPLFLGAGGGTGRLPRNCASKESFEISLWTLSTSRSVFHETMCLISSQMLMSEEILGDKSHLQQCRPDSIRFLH